MALWQKKFTAMEQAQAAASSISAQLTSAFAKNNSSQRSPWIPHVDSVPRVDSVHGRPTPTEENITLV